MCNDVPANAFSEPVRTMAPTELSESASFMASFNSRKSGELSAFKAFGRLSVMSATPGTGRAAMMFSYEVDMRRTLPRYRGAAVVLKDRRITERWIRWDIRETRLYNWLVVFKQRDRIR